MSQTKQDDLFPEIVKALGWVLDATALTNSDPVKAKRVKFARKTFEQARTLAN